MCHNITLDLPSSQTAGGDEGIDQTALTRYSAEVMKKYIIYSLQTRSQAFPASNVGVWIMGESETRLEAQFYSSYYGNRCNDSMFPQNQHKRNPVSYPGLQGGKGLGTYKVVLYTDLL